MFCVEDTGHGYVLYKDGVAVASFSYQKLNLNLSKGGKLKTTDFLGLLDKALSL